MAARRTRATGPRRYVENVYVAIVRAGSSTNHAPESVCFGDGAPARLLDAFVTVAVFTDADVGNRNPNVAADAFSFHVTTVQPPPSVENAIACTPFGRPVTSWRTAPGRT